MWTFPNFQCQLPIIFFLCAAVCLIPFPEPLTYRCPDCRHLLHRSSPRPRDWRLAHNRFEAPPRSRAENPRSPLHWEPFPGWRGPEGVWMRCRWGCHRLLSGRIYSSTGAGMQHPRPLPHHPRGRHCGRHGHSKHLRIPVVQPCWPRLVRIQHNRNWHKQARHRSWHCPDEDNTIINKFFFWRKLVTHHSRIAVTTRVEPCAMTSVCLSLDLGSISSGSTPQAALVLEEMRRVLVDGPVVTLSRLAHAHSLGQLLEALVQAEIMPNRVFPAHIGSSKEFIAV